MSFMFKVDKLVKNQSQENLSFSATAKNLYITRDSSGLMPFRMTKEDFLLIHQH
jgi:hypothetical protein